MYYALFTLLILVTSFIIYKILYFVWLRGKIKSKLDNLKFIEEKLNEKGVNIFTKLKRYLIRLRDKGIITDKENIEIYKLVVFYLKYDEMEDFLIVQNSKKIIVYLDKFYNQVVNDLVDLS